MESKIVKEIKKIKKDVSPRPEWVNLSRALLLKEINPATQPVSLGIFDYSKFLTQLFRQYLLEPAVIMLLIFATFLGSSLTINAAFYSLPGDPLYRVKIALEKTQLILIPGEKAKVELRIELAQKRMDELNKIAQLPDVGAEEKDKQIKEAVAEFKTNVIAVSSHLNKIKESIKQINKTDLTDNQADNSQTVMMAIAVSSKTEELAKALENKIEALPEAEKTEVKEIVADVVKSAQETGQSAQQLKDQLPPAGEIKGAVTSTEETTEMKSAADPAVSEIPTQPRGETTEKIVN